jgi:hypothetical protein
MKSNNFWDNAQEELADLINQRRIISKKIHILRLGINQHEKKPYINPDAGKNSPCFKHYGKRFKDLTPEEKREWAKLRKRESVKRQKTTKGD